MIVCLHANATRAPFCPFRIVGPTAFPGFFRTWAACTRLSPCCLWLGVCCHCGYGIAGCVVSYSWLCSKFLLLCSKLFMVEAARVASWSLACLAGCQPTLTLFMLMPAPLSLPISLELRAEDQVLLWWAATSCWPFEYPASASHWLQQRALQAGPRQSWLLP